jgi:hypothetical protein
VEIAVRPFAIVTFSTVRLKPGWNVHYAHQILPVDDHREAVAVNERVAYANVDRAHELHVAVDLDRAMQIAMADLTVASVQVVMFAACVRFRCRDDG